VDEAKLRWLCTLYRGRRAARMCEMDDLHRVNDEPPVEPDDSLPLPTDLVAKAIAYRTAASDSAGSAGQSSPDKAVPYTIDEAITDAIEQISGDPLPDPFTGDHNIEYWIWTGSRLVPASPEESLRLRRQEELEDEAFRARRKQQHLNRIRLRQALRHSLRRLAAPLLKVVEILRSSSATGKS
jgi:hypothetical protein